MGSQMGFSGRIGNVIHYKMGDKYYSRSAPRKYTQTKATKAKAKVFGKASGIGAQIRVGLSSVIPNSSDRKMHGLLVSQVFAWLQTLSSNSTEIRNEPIFDPLNSLNSKAVSLGARWRNKFPVINSSPGLLEIKIPSLVPKETFFLPDGAEEVICKIATTVIDISNIASIGQYATEVNYLLNDQEVAEQTISIELPMPEGSIIVTGLGLVYTQDKYFRKHIIADNSFLPSKIIHSMYL